MTTIEMGVHSCDQLDCIHCHNGDCHEEIVQIENGKCLSYQTWRDVSPWKDICKGCEHWEQCPNIDWSLCERSLPLPQIKLLTKYEGDY